MTKSAVTLDDKYTQRGGRVFISSNQALVRLPLDQARRVLAALKGLRGSAFDPFGYTAERRMERRLIGDYRALVSSIVDRLNPANLSAAIELARSAAEMGGYGPVKSASVGAYRLKLGTLLQAFEAAGQRQSRAA